MMVYSPRSGTKSTKSENTEEIPLTSAKRKRTPGKEKVCILIALKFHKNLLMYLLGTFSLGKSFLFVHLSKF